MHFFRYRDGHTARRLSPHSKRLAEAVRFGCHPFTPEHGGTIQVKDARRNSDTSAVAIRQSSRSGLAMASVNFRRVAMLIAALGSAALFAVAARSFAQSVSEDMDRSTRPGDDFYRYANGGWLAKTRIPEGKSSVDTRATVNEKTSERVRALIRDAAASKSAKGSGAQKVGDYYAAFMDESGIEAKGLTPLATEMSAISAITSKVALSAYLGGTLNSEVDGLTANADHVFGMWINQGFADADHNVVHFWQGGLGMPERDNYIDPSPKTAELRGHYQTHIASMLKMAGVGDSGAKAARILALEIRMAQAFAPDADAADVFKQNNPWKRLDFGAKAPGMDWDAYFKAAELSSQKDFIVWQPSAVIGISKLVGSENIEVWKDYLSFHLIEHYASVLPKAFGEEHFAFYGGVLSNSLKAPDRDTDALAATNGVLGQAVGELYTQRYFSPQAKAKAQAMVADLIAAYRTRISDLPWMAPDTKKKALGKLAALEVIVGYPDKWIDYATLGVERDNAFGNMRRAEAFVRLRSLTKLRQPVDPIEWPINPQVPGAVIMFSPNAEFFTAGILQPPYFDSEGDTASNYGSAGAGMAHEIAHSFDELGNIYDAHGRLGDWWTADDRAQYRAATAKLAAQLDAYCPFSDVCVNGKQVLTESVADLAGLSVAHDAYILSLKGKDDVAIGGLTGEQRFFLAFGQRWRKVQSEAALRSQIKTDTHMPGEYRSDSVRNVDAWYKAFDVLPSDKLYLKHGDRVGIW
jgi:putative endopeptidase